MHEMIMYESTLFGLETKTFMFLQNSTQNMYVIRILILRAILFKPQQKKAKDKPNFQLPKYCLLLADAPIFLTYQLY